MLIISHHLHEIHMDRHNFPPYREGWGHYHVHVMVGWSVMWRAQQTLGANACKKKNEKTLWAVKHLYLTRGKRLLKLCGNLLPKISLRLV